MYCYIHAVTQRMVTKDLKNLKTVNFGGWALAQDNMVVGT